jgi:unsaturated chondroitin disaccharide hydrolase
VDGAAAPTVPAADAWAAVGPQPGDVALPAPVAAAVSTLQQRYATSADALDPAAGFPRRVPAGATAWEVEPADDWTGGFFAGTLWETYALTGDAAWRARAQRWTAPLAGQATRTDTHDLGFVIGDSFGNAHRLTGDADAAATERTAARSLATRYSPTVHAIKSWDTEGDDDKRGQWRYPVIVDNLMNLDMLYQAAAQPGGDPQWATVATEHARTASRTNQRPDGSTAHVALFDPATGAFLGQETWQGLSPTSTWSRGQGWAIHGFTAAARSSGDPELRAAAVRAADWWLAHVPADGVPAWDFDAPGEERDTSAAAVAASGLLDLAALTGDPRYRQSAQTTLTTLAERDVAPTGPALLAHTVGGKPQGGEIDVGMVYTDHYFLEAARRWIRGG